MGRDKTRKRNTECGTEWRKRIPEADSANEDKTRIPQMGIKRGFRKWG